MNLCNLYGLKGLCGIQVHGTIDHVTMINMRFSDYTCKRIHPSIWSTYQEVCVEKLASVIHDVMEIYAVSGRVGLVVLDGRSRVKVKRSTDLTYRRAQVDMVLKEMSKDRNIDNVVSSMATVTAITPEIATYLVIAVGLMYGSHVTQKE